MNHRTVINIDYLKLYCVGGTWEDIADIRIKDLPQRSRHFKRVSAVFLFGERFAILEDKPHSKVLHPKAALLKIENRYLYSHSLGVSLRYLLAIIKADVKSISRLDIAIDFNYFVNGLYPENLIQNYMKKKVLKKGRGKFTVSGQQADTNRFHYLKFGSRTSPVQVYLYNKSKEMEDVTFKNYIFESWKNAQLDVDKNVWRLEFSLKSEATTYLDETCGEIIKLTWQDAIKQNVLRKLASSLADQYFTFVKPNGQSRITRMPKLKLLNLQESTVKRIRLTSEKDITRRDKVFLKNLYFEREINKEENPEYSESTNEVLKTLISNNYLLRYYHSRRMFWDQEINLLRHPKY